MADAITVNGRHRIVDPKTGLATAEELRWRNLVLARLGGGTAPTITELSLSDDEDSGLEDLRHEFNKAIEGLQALPPASEVVQIEFLLTQVSEAHALIAELRKEVEDLKQGQML